MAIYEIDVFNNHIILLVGDKRALLDTGATHSFGDGNQFQFLDETYDFMDGFLSFNLDSVADLLGTELHALLGNDVLKQQNFLVRWRQKTIPFSSTPFDLPGERIPIRFMMNVPLLDIEVAGKTCKTFWTQARISLPQS